MRKIYVSHIDSDTFLGVEGIRTENENPDEYRVILCSKPDPEEMSVESGLDDRLNHFDHHGQFSSNRCPAWLSRGDKRFQVLDFQVLEQIDTKGSSVVEDKDTNVTYHFMVGIGKVSRDLKIPRCTDVETDITDLFNKFPSTEEIIKIGKTSYDKSEKDYKDALVKRIGDVAFYVINDKDFDPSRPYQDGVKIVVLFREHYQTISLYSPNDSEYTFAGKVFGFVDFAGHPHGAGSPRGKVMEYQDAVKVFNDAVNLIVVP